jgi:hypothetical protein
MRYQTKCGLLVATTFLWLPKLAIGADLNKPIPNAALQQAQVSLQAQQQLTNAQTYKALGFKSIDEVKRTTLGTPLRVYMVRLDKLKEYVASRDPKELLDDTNSVRYPVFVGEEVRSGVVVREVGTQWQVESVGRPALTKALVSAAKSEGRSAGAGGTQFAVTIPALNLFFIGHLANEKLELTSTADDPQFNIKAGQTLPAAEAFEQLVPYAKQMKTGPYLTN